MFDTRFFLYAEKNSKKESSGWGFTRWNQSGWWIRRWRWRQPGKKAHGSWVGPEAVEWIWQTSGGQPPKRGRRWELIWWTDYGCKSSWLCRKERIEPGWRVVGRGRRTCGPVQETKAGRGATRKELGKAWRGWGVGRSSATTHFKIDWRVQSATGIISSKRVWWQYCNCIVNLTSRQSCTEYAVPLSSQEDKRQRRWWLRVWIKPWQFAA